MVSARNACEIKRFARLANAAQLCNIVDTFSLQEKYEEIHIEYHQEPVREESRTCLT